MRKLFTTMALAAVTLTASAAVNYETYPAEGTVSSLKEIQLALTDFGRMDYVMLVNGDEQVSIPVTCDGESYAYATAQPAERVTGLEISLAEEITKAGEYKITIPANTMKVGNRTMTTIEEDIVLTYNIEEGAGGEYFTDYIAIPEEGVVDKLESVWVTINNVKDVASTYDTSKIAIKKDGQPIEIDFSDSLEYDDDCTTYCAITFDEPITEPGTYEVIFGAGYITTSQNFSDYTPLEQPIKLTYTIEGNGGDDTGFDFTKYTATPSNESTIDEISTVTMTFYDVDSAECTVACAFFNENNVAEENIKIVNEGNTVKFEFTPAITEAGNLKIVIPNGGMRLNKGGATEVNSTTINLTYTIESVPSVEYVYEFGFSNPRPNEDGEISTEKDLEGMQFYISNTKGLDVPEDLSEETVATMKQTDGEWETTGSIRKTYGFDTSHSYILIVWKAQPRNEGEYTITIPQGVMGDEAWVANHKTGKTNKETVLTFKLVSPSNAIEDITVEAAEANGVYNLMGVRVANNLENLPAGIYIYGGKKIVVK